MLVSCSVYMNLRSLFWSVCYRVSPSLHLTLKSMLGARRSRAFERRSGQISYTAAFIQRHGTAVLTGPFKGLKFPAAAFTHNLVPKLMGVYEFQLHGAVEAAISRRPRQVVDIGAAEGYYAAGLAMRLPEARIYAFDAAPVERKICHQVAVENALTERIKVNGICTTTWLQEHLRPGDFVFSDCEGGESALIDPKQVPALLNCDLLVETHDHEVPGVTNRLLERFRQTHEVTCLKGALAPQASLPIMESWSTDDYNQALNDGRASHHGRPDQDWLVFIARDRGSSGS